MPKATEPKTTVRWSAEQHAKLQALSDETGFAFAAIVKECVDRGYPDVARRLRRGDATLRQAPTETYARVTQAEEPEIETAEAVPTPTTLSRTGEPPPAIPTARDILKARSEAMRGRQP